MDDQSKFLDAEDMVPCPYNEAHIVTRKRLAIHITKCRKQHTELSKDMKQCSHNIQHIIPREEFEVIDVFVYCIKYINMFVLL